ncbi:MAG: NAD(P)-binding protein [Chloroflexi bacterium]|nr:NAD(P)-binding protein [Chloroflexota bacterium]
MCVYDIIVVGAGPAGNVAASRLSSKGFRVAVLDRRQEIENRRHGTVVKKWRGSPNTVQRFRDVGHGATPVDAPGAEWLPQVLYFLRHVMIFIVRLLDVG